MFNNKKNLFIALIGLIGLTFIFYIYIQSRSTPIEDQVTNKDINYIGYTYNNAEIDPIIKQYEALHPKTSITYTYISKDLYTTYLHNRLSSKNSNIIPDIFEAPNTDLNSMEKFLSTNNNIATNTFKTQYYPIYQRGLIKNNRIIGIPEDLSPLILIYNKKILSKYKITPDDLAANVHSFNTLTKKIASGENPSISTNIGISKLSINPDILQLFMLENQTSMNDKNGTATFNTNKGIEALDYFNEFLNGDYADHYDNGSVYNYTSLFSQGKIGVIFGYPEDINTIKAANPSFEIGYALYPSLVKPITLGKYNFVSVYNQSKRQQESWDFLTYLNSTENLTKLNNLPNQNHFRYILPLQSAPINTMDQNLINILKQASLNAVDWRTPQKTTLDKIFLNIVNTSITEGETSQSALIQGVNEINSELYKEKNL